MKKNIATKMMNYLMTATMIVGGLSLSPLTTVEVQAAVIARNVNLNIGNSISGLITNAGYSGNSTIYYASKTGTGYPWKIVATPSGKLTLFSTEYLGDLSGYSGSIHNNWSASSICDKLNGRSTYIENGILPTYFTNTEKCDDVINEYGDTDTSGPDVASIDIRQKLVLPSVQEVKDGAHGI